MASLISVIEASTLLNVSKVTVYRLVETGQIMYVRIGSRVLFRPEQLEAWITEHTKVSVHSGDTGVAV